MILFWRKAMKIVYFYFAMRLLIPLLVFIALCGCDNITEQDNNSRQDSAVHVTVSQTTASQDSNTQFLVAAAAADFHQQNAKAPIRFRNTYVGQSVNTDGEKLFLLCGAFEQAAQNDWVPFVTIRTSGYEQWIGGQAVAFCSDTTIAWNKAQDLSAVLQAEYDALLQQ